KREVAPYSCHLEANHIRHAGLTHVSLVKHRALHIRVIKNTSRQVSISKVDASKILFPQNRAREIGANFRIFGAPVVPTGYSVRSEDRQVVRICHSSS